MTQDRTPTERGMGGDATLNMQTALQADREKLIALGGDPGPVFITCDNCGGEGGWEVAVAGRAPPWGDGADDGYWVACPSCHGAGWDIGEPENLTRDDLDERVEP